MSRYKVGFTRVSPETGQEEFDSITVDAPTPDDAVEQMLEATNGEGKLYGVETVSGETSETDGPPIWK